MEVHQPLKYLVKIIPVVRPGQKTLFRIRHPENALYLSGIAVTGTFQGIFGDGGGRTDTTGSLSLAIPEEGDVFYTEDIKWDNYKGKDITERNINQAFVPDVFAYGGGRYEYFETHIPITDAIMEGYYEDNSIPRYGRIGIGFGGLEREQEILFLEGYGAVDGGVFVPPPIGDGRIDVRLFYKITLYLRYQMKEEKKP